MATDAPKKQRSLSYRLHDALNVPLVGGLSVMCILGLLGLMDAHLITKIFITYITFCISIIIPLISIWSIWTVICITICGTFITNSIIICIIVIMA